MARHIEPHFWIRSLRDENGRPFEATIEGRVMTCYRYVCYGCETTVYVSVLEAPPTDDLPRRVRTRNGVASDCRKQFVRAVVRPVMTS